MSDPSILTVDRVSVLSDGRREDERVGHRGDLFSVVKSAPPALPAGFVFIVA